MSGGGGSTTAEIGGGLLAAGAIASMVMTGGADAPLAGAALEGDSALMGGDAALGTVDAAGNIVGGGAAGASVGSGLAGADAGITAGDVAATGSGINTLSALDNNLAPQYMSDISSPSSQYAAQDMENGINAGTGTGSTIASNTVAPSVPTSSSMDQAMAQDLENGLERCNEQS
jgi:hypothetical protein